MGSVPVNTGTVTSVSLNGHLGLVLCPLTVAALLLGGRCKYPCEADGPK